MVVRDGDADHRDGTSSSTRVPAPSLELITRLPPKSRASSSTSDSPRWPSVSRRSRIAGSNPRPSSEITSRASVVVDRQLDPHRVRIRVRDHVAHGLLRDAIDERLLLAVEPLGSVDRKRHLRAVCLERADEVGDRGLEPRRREMRRVELDEQRAQVADRSTKTVDRRTQDGGVVVCSTCSCAVGKRREGEREACDVLHRSVVKVRSNAAALAGRRRDRVPE